LTKRNIINLFSFNRLSLLEELIDFKAEKEFEEQLYVETLHNERFRFLLVAGVVFVLLVFASIMLFLFNEQFQVVFKGQKVFYLIILLLFIMLAREMLLRFVLGRRLEAKKYVPNYLKFTNAFFEISVPTVGIILYTEALYSIIAFSTPVILIYFIFITLSTLELDFKLSVFTGAVASVEYFLLVLYYLGKVDTTGVEPIIREPMMYFAKSLIILLCGIVAGFVALEIKKRILKSFRIISERNQIERWFGQQVSKAIVDEMLKNKRGIVSKRRTVCVMFLDIRNFSGYAADKEPEEIVKYQNDVFSFMIEIINKHNGIINQILGDGFMATFGAPISYDNDCLNAVNAAYEIISELKRKTNNNEIPSTLVGIGIHTGEAVTGNVGTSIRKQYSITGSVVILASRIEQLNKEYNSQLLISKDVFDKIEGRITEYEFIGAVELRGSEEPITIYKLA
jgi:adenylate cyclase